MIGRRVLVIDDDPMIRYFLVRGLSLDGFEVTTASTGDEAVTLATHIPFRVGIIDLNLGSESGIEVLERLRGEKHAFPVLFLSVEKKVHRKTEALNAGGDDFVTKPFDLSELIARLNALIRRTGESAANVPTRPGARYLKWGDLDIDTDSYRTTCRTTEIHLTVNEFAVLELLVRRRGTVVTRSELLEHVWNYSFDPQTNVVDVTVLRLRKKIAAGCDGNRILTVRGRGYMIE